MTTIAEALIEVRADTSRVASDIERSTSTASKSGSKMGKALGIGITAGATGVLAAGAFLKGALGEASDLSETVNKSTVIFGKNADAILKWSETSDTALGLSQQEALAASASFGDMFSQIGFTSDAAAKMSKEVVTLSADLGSFNNLETADVAERMSAAFRGEFDSLQALVPNINAARVETEALEATGKKTAEALTAQEKAAAVLAIVTEDGARAQGDFARTSDGMANQSKIAAAQFDNLKAKIGESLMPVVTDFMGYLTKTVIPNMEKWWDSLAPAREAIGKFASGVGELVGLVRDGKWGEAFGAIRDALEAALRKAVDEARTYLLDKLLPNIVQWVGKIREGWREKWRNFWKDPDAAYAKSYDSQERWGERMVKASGRTGVDISLSFMQGVRSIGPKVAAEGGRILLDWQQSINGMPSLARGIAVRAGVELVQGIRGAGTKVAAAGAGLIGDFMRGLSSPVSGLGVDLANAIRTAVNTGLGLPFTINGPGKLPDFTIPAFARGTDYAPGGVALVGEEGPELVTLPRGSKVATAARTRAMAARGGVAAAAASAAMVGLLTITNWAEGTGYFRLIAAEEIADADDFDDTLGRMG